jgi:hypothetical protein
MTSATSHIEKTHVEGKTAKVSLTNSMPKTVMGSGIAPPRLSNIRRSSLRNCSIQKEMGARSQY